MDYELNDSSGHSWRKWTTVLRWLKIPYRGIKNTPHRLRILHKNPETTTPIMYRPIFHIAIWVTSAALVGIGLYNLLIPRLVGPTDSRLDAVQLILAIMAGVGAVFLGVYAYRRQRLQEVASVRDDYGQFLLRYNSATQQIADDKAAARLAGVYAMTRLADDWPAQRQQCVDVLCAYLRMPPTSDPGDDEVRSTILRVIVERIRYKYHPDSWSSLSFNFDRAVFYDLDMTGVEFYGPKVSFRGAHFQGVTNFSHTIFGTQARFDRASFTGPFLSFDFASFEGNIVSFRETKMFSEITSFTGSLFCVNEGSFDSAVLGGDLTTFRGTEFDGRHLSFNAAIFRSCRSEFCVANFNGYITFKQTQFVDTCAVFEQANFYSRPSFEKISLINTDMRVDRNLAELCVGLEEARIDKNSSITVE